MDDKQFLPKSIFPPANQQWDVLSQRENKTLTVGDPCPHCGKAALIYNGLLQIICPHCGYLVESGAFT